MSDSREDSPAAGMLVAPPPQRNAGLSRSVSLGVFIGVFVAIGVVGYVYLSWQIGAARERAHGELAAISRLKSGHVATWYSEQVGDAEFYMTVPVVAETAAALIADPAAAGPRRMMNAVLESAVHRAHCNRVLLFDREQRVVMSFPEGKDVAGDRAKSFAKQALGSNKVIVSDLHRSKMEPGSVDMDVFAPLFTVDSGGVTSETAVGVMMFETSPETYLYGYLKFWPKESPSAESLLVRKEDDDSILYLSPLRHVTNAPLTLRKSIAANSRSPAAMAALGHEGVVEAVDYRGVPVLADVCKVRGTPWYMVSKVDQDEVYAELRRQAWNTGVMIALLLAVAALTVAFEWGRREKTLFRDRLAAESDYRILFERMSDGFAEHEIVLDQAGRPADYRFLRVNQAFERQTGLRGADIVGKTVLQVIPNLDFSWIERYGRVALTGEPIEFENHVPALGRYYFVKAFRTVPGHFACLFSDITERKNAEAALRASREEISSVLGSISDAFFSLDEQLVVTYWNAAAERIMRRSREEVLGCNLFDVFPEARGSVFETNYTTAIREKKAMAFEVYFPVPRYENWYDVRVYPRESGISVFFQVVTDRKRLEIERERITRELSVKNAELESLVYAASHDLRTPLVNMQGFSGRIDKVFRELKQHMDKAGTLDELREKSKGIMEESIPGSLRYISTSVAKMDGLIKGLLQLSRAGRAELTVVEVDMNRLVGSLVASMDYSIQQVGAAVALGVLPSCRGDVSQLEQVFANLLDNALKYRDPARELRVSISGRRQGDMTIYIVEDTGKGIPSTVLDKIWELFYRVDGDVSGEGEGLGLTLVRQIVQRHGGRAWVESELGKGSRFFVELKAV